MDNTEKTSMQGNETKPIEKESNPGKERTYHCNDCGAVIYKHQIFCSQCGKLLDRMDYVD